MLDQPTRDKLLGLGLDAMVTAWDEQSRSSDMSQLGFDERLGLLVDRQWNAREDKRLARRLKEAKLKITQASIEGIEYPLERKLDRALVRQLASCRWIEEHQGAVITGATGTGKSYLACALADQACRRGHRVLYARVPRLLQELALARADGSHARALVRIARFDLLVLEDFGLTTLRDGYREDLLEVMEDRYGTRSTIVSSQLPPDRWHEYIGDPTLGDAICERLLHNTHRIALKGPSRRKEKRDAA